MIYPTQCPECSELQYSLFDKKYLELNKPHGNNQCWGCDKTDWGQGVLSLHDFEKREELVLLNVETD